MRQGERAPELSPKTSPSWPSEDWERALQTEGTECGKAWRETSRTSVQNCKQTGVPRAGAFRRKGQEMRELGGPG